MQQPSEATALLVMDFQEKIFHNIPDAANLISRVANVIVYARRKQIPVIFVAVGFREGFPEINTCNKGFSLLKTQHQHGSSVEDWIRFVPGLAPLPSDITVVKKRYSAFAGNDLEIILRAKGITHLVMAGVVSSGVVLSTATQAADKDFRITILSDGCADRDEMVQQVLMDRIFTRYGNVISCARWTGGYPPAEPL